VTENGRNKTTRAAPNTPSSAERSQLQERRRRRSGDVITALHYQLSVTRSEGDLEAVVLVDDRGCLVAGAGPWPACEELAAYTPLLTRPRDVRSKRVSARVAQLSGEVESLSFHVDGTAVVLCGRGGSRARSASLSRAALGCRRILAA